MSNNKKFFICALTMLLAIGANNAKAQNADATNNIANPAVLYKIHDVKPVVSADGVTTSCDFVISFYNRTENTINGASLELSWEDTTIKSFLAQEEKEDTKSKRQRRTSSTSRQNEEIVAANIEVPTMKSLQQTAVKTRLQSDRCFLLMGEVNTKVKSCNMGTQQAQSRTMARATNTCGNLFKYVSPENPEYYREFSNVSAEQELSEKAAEKERVKKEIEQDYVNALSEFERASKLLSEIK